LLPYGIIKIGVKDYYQIIQADIYEDIKFISHYNRFLSEGRIKKGPSISPKRP